MNKLTGKQKAFVEAYADPNSKTCNNAYQSALAANYSVATAKQACVIVVENCSVKPAIEAYLVRMKAKTVATRQQRQQFWTDVYQVKTNNMADRLRASELLGRSEADFTDKIQDTTEQQRELTEAEQAEAKRIADIRLRTG